MPTLRCYESLIGRLLLRTIHVFKILHEISSANVLGSLVVLRVEWSLLNGPRVFISRLNWTNREIRGLLCGVSEVALARGRYSRASLFLF